MKQPVQYRSGSAAAQEAQAQQPAVSFASDIRPLFQPFREQMMWRLDLTNYDAVRANAGQIWEKISNKLMPPTPLQPLTDEQIATFKSWMAAGFPP